MFFPKKLDEKVARLHLARVGAKTDTTHWKTRLLILVLQQMDRINRNIIDNKS